MNTMTRHAVGAMLVALALAGAGGAYAQIANSDEPVEVTADRVEALRSDGRAVYSGNVNATQGITQIKSDTLTIVCARPAGRGQPADNACGEIEQMIAEGNVFYTTPEEKIRGDRAEYDYRSDTITITGDVIMSRGDEGVIRGTRLIYDVAAGRATVTAGGTKVQSIFIPTARDGSSGNP
jgi:lipopolysaccharide export system protein LptA